MLGHPEQITITTSEKPQQMAIIPTLSPFLWPRLGLVKDMKTANRIRAWHIGKERLNGLRVNWRKFRLKLLPLRWPCLGLHRFTVVLRIIHPQTNIKTYQGMDGQERLLVAKKLAVATRTTEWKSETSLKRFIHQLLLLL